MDITMCKGGACKRKRNCFRYMASPDKFYQSYFETPPCSWDGNMCGDFIQLYCDKCSKIINNTLGLCDCITIKKVELYDIKEELNCEELLLTILSRHNDAWYICKKELTEEEFNELKTRYSRRFL